MVDPTVEVTLRTFIPSEAVGVPYPSHFINGGDAGEDSGRSPVVALDEGLLAGELVPGADFSASDEVSFRTSQSAVLNFGSDGEPLSGAARGSAVGITTLYSKDDASEIEQPGLNWRFDLNDGAQPVDEAQFNPQNVTEPEILVGPEGADFSINFQLSGTNPLPPPFKVLGKDIPISDLGPIENFVPSFDAEFDLSVSQNENGDIEYQVGGAHDGFPAYELYINDTFVYKYDPIAAGENPLALFPGEDINVPLISGTIPPEDVLV